MGFHPQDYPAGWIHPSRCDTPLPETVRAERLRPRRARIPIQLPPPPQRPPQVNQARFRVYSVLGWSLIFGVIMILIAVALSWPSPDKHASTLNEPSVRSLLHAQMTT